jgi:hypothetical protein
MCRDKGYSCRIYCRWESQQKSKCLTGYLHVFVQIIYPYVCKERIIGSDAGCLMPEMERSSWKLLSLFGVNFFSSTEPNHQPSWCVSHDSKDFQSRTLPFNHIIHTIVQPASVCASYGNFHDATSWQLVARSS